MRVTVRLFGQLRDLAGAADLECDVDTSAAEPPRVRDVWQALVRDHAALGSFGRALSAAVNLDYVRMDAPVREGDEVAFLPPVSGGSDDEGRAGRDSAGSDSAGSDSAGSDGAGSDRAGAGTVPARTAAAAARSTAAADGKRAS